MAEEVRKVITVDVDDAVSSLNEMRDEVESTGYAFRSLGDAKKYLDALRASLLDLDEESEEYEERVAEIDKVQEKLNKAMKVTGTTIKVAEGSYNALTKKMSDLKKAFKATSDEMERKELAKQIVGINDKLKEMDASIGNYQRNVGNYEAAFTKGLTNITAKIEALGNPLAIAKNGVMALSKALKTLIANPVGAVIMVIVGALAALKKGFDKSETASNSLKKAFAALEPVMNAVSNVLTGFATIVGKVAEKAIPALVNAVQKASVGIMTLLNNLGIVSDEKLEAYKKSIEAQKEAIKVSQDLTNREISLVQRRRDLQVDTAKKELEISELRAKAADKDKYSSAERQKFLEQAVSTERKLNNEKLLMAQEEYDIALARSKQTANDAAANDALAAAEANLYNTKKEYYDKERKLVSQINSARSEDAANAKAAQKEKDEAYKAAQKIIEDDLKKIDEINNRARLNLMDDVEREKTILKEKYEEEKSLMEQYHKDTTKLTEEYNKKLKEIDDKAKEGDTKKIGEIQERVRLSMLSDTDKQLDILKKRYEEEKKLLETYGEDTVRLTEEYKREVDKVKASKGEKDIQNIDEEATMEQYIADKTIQIEYDKKQKLLDIDRERLEGKKKIYEDLMNLDNLSEEEKQKYADKLAQINADIVENSNQSKELQKQHILDLVDTYSQVTESIGNLMGEISDIWQDSIKERQKNGKITEEQAKKEFESSKKLQIATAIINGLAGVATAVATAMELGPIAGPIMAAVNSALVITTTAAQIAKIKSTTFDGGGSSSSGGGVTPVVPSQEATAYTPNYTTNVTGASDTVNLANAVSSGQKDQRVYVVESDINQVGRRVEVRESESTF